MIAAARELMRGLAGADYNRFPTSTAAAASFKQWVHLVVLDPAIALIANFSALPRAGGRAHRQAVLVHAGALRGHLRDVPAARCEMPAGQARLRFDRSALISTGAHHILELDEPALALRAQLHLRAVARPAVLHHLALGPRGPRGTGGGFHWAVVPRLVATGTIEHADRVHAVRDAPAYRDRNWGSFGFGDVAWDWGYAAAPAGGPPCAIAFARLLDAARTQIVEQHVLVWWGDRLLAAFRDREVELACEGASDGRGTPAGSAVAWPPGSRDGAMLTLPPALALCRPGHATGVPDAVTVTAASSRGRLALRFTRGATARIVVPNDVAGDAPGGARLGTTAIHESFGDAAVTGEVEGEDVGFASRGLFECVHA